jgi:chromate transporter
MPNQPTFREALAFWFKLGWISFGGPAGQVAIMHEYVVSQKKWVSPSRFLHALNYCMLLPGPEAQQLATYLGWLLHGARGGLVAGVLFILPSILVLWVLSLLYVWYGQTPILAAVFAGIKPAILAIVALALLKMVKKSLSQGWHYVLALGAFGALFFFNIAFPLVVLGALLIGFLQNFWQKNRALSNAESASDEAEYYLKSSENLPPWRPWSLFLPLFLGLGLWLLPWLIFYPLSSDGQFWQTQSLFFTQAALVTFGGAYAVLPYVAQVSVEKYQWLSKGEMIDGLALGESTPGPLIMVLAFVGFMAGYRHFGGDVAMGTFALLNTTFYTFLPSFCFVLAGAPLIERSQQQPVFKAMLGAVGAAVAGVMLNLLLYLGKSLILPQFPNLQPDWFALGWFMVSLLALQRFKVGMLWWIGISAVAGLLFEIW